jgi:nitroreductase
MPDMPLAPDELLTTTRSVRKRLDLTRPVPLDLVKECLEIALQAPSGGMRQGWHWIVVTDPEVRAQIGDFYRRSTESYLASQRVTGRAVGIAAARRVELHAGLPGQGPRYRLDHTPLAVRDRDRRAARAPR